MLLYVIRHGESTANVSLVHSGWDDVSLSPNGSQQALGLRSFISSIHFDGIYTSDLLRAKQTMRNAFGDNRKYVETSLLREYCVGELARHTKDECLQKYGPKYIQNVNDRDFTEYHGENYQMLQTRLVTFLESLDISKMNNCVLFTHDGIIRCLLDLALKHRVSYDSVYCPNCCISIFGVSPQHVQLISWNLPILA